MNKKDLIFRRITFFTFEIFAVVTLLLMIKEGGKTTLLLAAATIVLLILPNFVEKLFRLKFSLSLYIFSLFYAIGPALGHCYKFYAKIPVWDKLLHISGGIVFAIFGIFIFEKIVGEDKKKLLMAVIFGFLFSVTIAVFWEFCEFASDRFLSTDMQDDVMVNYINSYKLGGETGGVGRIENIEEVTINGEKLPMRGYIDIGLTDTMYDMLLETAGAAAVSLFFIFPKGKTALFWAKI